MKHWSRSKARALRRSNIRAQRDNRSHISRLQAHIINGQRNPSGEEDSENEQAQGTLPLQSRERPVSVYTSGHTSSANAKELIKTYLDNVLEIGATLPISDWRIRESIRSRTKYHIPDFVLSEFYQKSPYVDLHYLHFSKKEPDCVAFTPDPESGVQNKKRRMKYEAYIDKFFSSLSYHERTIIKNSFRFQLDERKPVFYAASEDIVRSIVNADFGPMSKPAEKYDIKNEKGEFVHPASVLGGISDITLAVIQEDSNVVAWAYVWGTRKIFASPKGVDAELLGYKLMRMGYKFEGADKQGFSGAKLKRVEIPKTVKDENWEYEVFDFVAPSFQVSGKAKAWEFSKFTTVETDTYAIELTETSLILRRPTEKLGTLSKDKKVIANIAGKATPQGLISREDGFCRMTEMSCKTTRIEGFPVSVSQTKAEEKENEEEKS